MKKLTLFLILILICEILSGNSKFEFLSIKNLNFGYSSNSPFLFEYNNNFYFEGYTRTTPTGIYKIDFDNTELSFVTELTRIYCLVDSRFYAQYTKNSFPQYGFYKLEGDYWGGVDSYNELKTKGFGHFPLVYYQDDITFTSGQEYPSSEELAYSNNIPIKFSGAFSVRGSYASFEKYLTDGEFVSITPDKMHLLERNQKSSIKILKIIPFPYKLLFGSSIPDPQIILELKRNYGTAFDFDSQFITNSLFISMVNYGQYSLYHLEKGLIDEFTFQANGEDIEKRLKFSKDLTRAMAGKSLVDTSEFKNYLIKKGLLFTETTGTILSDNIQAYENANIYGEIQGKLKNGTEVKVLDQSGAKDTFEGKTDYWYQIQSDKIIGWVFGSHLAFEGKNQKISDDSNQAKPEKTASLPKPLHIKNLEVTSALTEPKDKDAWLVGSSASCSPMQPNHPVKAFDSNPKTMWIEAAKGPGLGEYLEVEFSHPITIDRIEMQPGCFWDENYWKQNNRVKDMTITLDDKSLKVKFSDVMKTQGVGLKKPVTIQKARFTIDSVYKTTNWDDTAISDIWFVYKDRRINIDLGDYAGLLK